jgi:hypothetical protein
MAMEVAEVAAIRKKSDAEVEAILSLVNYGMVYGTWYRCLPAVMARLIVEEHDRPDLNRLPRWRILGNGGIVERCMKAVAPAGPWVGVVLLKDEQLILMHARRYCSDL